MARRLAQHLAPEAIDEPNEGDDGAEGAGSRWFHWELDAVVGEHTSNSGGDMGSSGLGTLQGVDAAAHKGGSDEGMFVCSRSWWPSCARLPRVSGFQLCFLFSVVP